MTRLYWDFYGGDSAGTAAHFVRHLEAWLARNDLTGAPTGVESDRPGHGAAFVEVPASAVDALILALRPKRRLDLPEP